MKAFAFGFLNHLNLLIRCGTGSACEGLSVAKVRRGKRFGVTRVVRGYGVQKVRRGAVSAWCGFGVAKVRCGKVRRGKGSAWVR